ncbi:MAG TPA: AmmeMemoRadiSam system protein A [Candidatus Aminicenantes bacterium]|nr:AmmeMemoRadiSam system protein A [Candidatus Aminicenantes bacterium]HRY63987.1 AmmeMemoRadiSam system protein A [Candidatus Aminicenantes bacterium]HRZ70900.1 AmmeMemoRadiSam system protein A [Candidatus Aminicenantes bacterium]
MSEPLTPEEEQTCLRLARRALEYHFETGLPLRSPVRSGPLKAKRGAFVTLTVDGELRGCIGYPLPVKPLDETIIEMAVAAATQDTRFEPLAAGEMDRLKIEISVLGLPERTEADQVEVGRHGIIVSKGYFRGLLLPQVPLEHHWDRETFLRHGCLKAGLPPEEWKRGAEIETFTAQVFSE